MDANKKWLSIPKEANLEKMSFVQNVRMLSLLRVLRLKTIKLE